MKSIDCSGQKNDDYPGTSARKRKSFFSFGSRFLLSSRVRRIVPIEPVMPTPKASVIVLSPMQQQVLEQIVRQTTNPYRLVRRAQLVLLAAGGSTNSKIAQQLKLDRGQVRHWRARWLEAQAQLSEAEAQKAAEAALRTLIVAVFEDEARAGTPAKFNLEQVVQIVALACEAPQSSGRPISEWTVRELADEAVRRGIVEQISPRSVGRFLKRGTTATAPESLLAERSTRKRNRI